MHLSFENVDQVCTGVDLENERSVIDLSNVDFFRPFALVYLGMFLRYHNSKGKSFIVNVPVNVRARNYLAQQNFWDRFNFNPEAVQRENLRKFSTSSSLNDIIDIEREQWIAERIADMVMQVLLRNHVKVNINLVAELVSELVDNFQLHSECLLAACAMQYYPNLRRVVFAVGDCGIGIRSSLITNQNYKYLSEEPHHVAALKAFDPLVSRLPEGGTGLFEVREQIINLNGRLTLATGDGYVVISKGTTTYGTMAYNLTGVQMELSFPEEQLA